MPPFHIVFQLLTFIVPTFAALWAPKESESQIPFHSQPSDNKYEGALWRFKAENQDIFEWTLQVAQDYSLDVWGASEHFVDIYTAGDSVIPKALLSVPHTTSNLSTTVQIPPRDSYTSAIDRWNLTSLENTTYHAAYHPSWEIDEFMHTLAELYPDEVTILRLGHTAMGREIYGMQISHSTKSSSSKAKPGFLITGAQHAREWVAISTALYISHALVSNSSESQSMRELLDDFDFYVVPSPNPDGYDHTWETDRFWYKNRQVVDPVSPCVGIDTNRNWGYKWKPHSALGNLGKGKKKKKPVPDDPCSTWYPGHRAFEAPEVNNLANFVSTLNGAGGPHAKIKAFVDLRSYGQMLSTPYSFSCKRLPKDAEDQLEAALGSVQALRVKHGTVFKTGNLCSTLYRAPGNIVDWMYARAGIKYSYAAFLRDTGTYGFSLPAEWIRPVGEETGKMIEYLAKFIAKQQK
ncbi:peptidase M14 family protein [Pleurotus pulmonarius]